MNDPVSAFAAGNQQFQIDGPAGALEVASAAPAASRRLGTAIICHPHPLYGGSMQNKVVTTTERALRELGLGTLRFNFRGVGHSGGSFDDGRGEGDDLLAVAHWLRRVRPTDALWLAGFSFGAMVSISRAVELAPAQLISLAPPIGRFALHAISAPDCPWLVIQPAADEVVDAAAVFAWAEQLADRIDLVRLSGSSHFFHGRLPELRAAIQAGVRAPLPELETARS